jgi:hypothetical protein
LRKRVEARTGAQLATVAAPELLPGLDFYLTAFLDLFGDRPAGDAGARIPWTARESYALACGLVGWQKNRFHALLTALDEAYLTYWNERREKQQKADEKRKTQETRRISRKR